MHVGMLGSSVAKKLFWEDEHKWKSSAYYGFDGSLRDEEGVRKHSRDRFFRLDSSCQF